MVENYYYFGWKKEIKYFKEFRGFRGIRKNRKGNCGIIYFSFGVLIVVGVREFFGRWINEFILLILSSYENY